jgi:hypothetical protein
MFNGFPSTQTPTVQWWDYSRSNTGTNTISLANDCAPVQFFATGGSTTAINLYLPSSSAQGKTIIVKNDSYVQNVNQSIIIYDTSAKNTSYQIVASVGAGGSVTLCYIAQNTLTNRDSFNTSQNWVTINNTSNGGAYNTFSTNAGGYNNRTVGIYAVVSGGLNNTSNNNYSVVAGGNSNSAGGQYGTTSGGNINNNQGNYSTISGGSNNSSFSSYSTIVGGYTNSVNADHSVINGSYGKDRSIIGNSISSACFAPITTTQGASQSSLLVLGRQTTNATATVLCSDSSAATTTNQVILPNNSAYVFQGTCIANITGGSTTSGWKFEGVIKRGANAASTTLVAAVTPTVIAQDVAAATWVLAITADTTNGGIAVTVTGVAATTIRWVSKIESTEVTY